MKGYQFNPHTLIYEGKVDLQIDPIKNIPLMRPNTTLKAIPSEPIAKVKTYQWNRDMQEWKEIADNSGEWYRISDGVVRYLQHFDDSVNPLSKQIAYNIENGVLTNQKGESFVRFDPHKEDYHLDYLEWDAENRQWRPTRDLSKIIPSLKSALNLTYKSINDSLQYEKDGVTYTFQTNDNSIAFIQQNNNLAKILGGITWFDNKNQPIYFKASEFEKFTTLVLTRHQAMFLAYQQYKQILENIVDYQALIKIVPNYDEFIKKTPKKEIEQLKENLMQIDINIKGE